MDRPQASLAPAARFIEKYRQLVPEHELEMLLEAAYVSEFPAEPRPTRSDLHGLARNLVEGKWLLLAENWLQQRLQGGTPIQHLTREACFYGRHFEVGPEALIPRPETESLVQAVLEEFKIGAGRELRGAEVGLGSGVISITLLAELGKSLSMVASELELPALELAKRNAARLGVASQLEGVHVLDPLAVLGSFLGREPFDFLVSNPPYLVKGGGEAELEVVRTEPHRALFAPPQDALYFYREIASGAVNLLKPGGLIALEIPHERSREIEQLFLGPASRFKQVSVKQDLSGRDRVLVAYLR